MSMRWLRNCRDGKDWVSCYRWSSVVQYEKPLQYSIACSTPYLMTSVLCAAVRAEVWITVEVWWLTPFLPLLCCATWRANIQQYCATVVIQRRNLPICHPMPLRDAPAPCCECSLCILPDLQRRSCRVLHGSASPLPAFSNHAMHALPPFRLSLMPPSPPRSPHRAPSYPSSHFNLPHASIQVTCSPSSHGPDKHVGQTKTIAMVGSVSVPPASFHLPLFLAWPSRKP